MERMTVVGKLCFNKNPNGLIGEGSYGHVFVGYYENIQEVAIKRLQKLSFHNMYRRFSPTRGTSHAESLQSPQHSPLCLVGDE